MSRKTAKADVIPVRQQNQYNCMTTSLSMALRAQGVPDEECDVQRVNKVVGAMPLRGAAWEPLLAAATHYGMRATLTLPSTVRQLKQWTDAGIPVVIAWNPENREWSHASLVFDVDDDLNVYVADPNIPDPDETVRVVPKAEFYGKWYEKSPQGFLIRRPACAIQREITADGRQVMASQKKVTSSKVRVAEDYGLSRRVAEGADTYSDARGSGYGSSRDYMSAVSEFNRARREAERGGWREYFSRWSEWATSMLLGYATEVDDPAVMWFATKWAKRKKKTKYGRVRGMILEDALGREKALSPEHRREILALLQELRAAWDVAPFEGDWFAELLYDRDGVKYEPRWLEQYRRKAERFKPMKARPVAPKTVVDSATAEKVGILDKLSEAAADNASLVALIEQAKGAYQSGKNPTDSELKAIRHGLYRNRMRNEANHFRQASASCEKVAEKYLESKRKRRTTEVREKKVEDKVKVKVPRGGNPHAEDAASRKPTRGHTRKERPRNKARNPRKHTKHKKPLAASIAERFSSGAI